MIIRTHAFARAGLIGNPSDGYFGKTISVICRNFAAEIVLYESPRITMLRKHHDQLSFGSLAELAEDVRMHGYYGAIRLIKAAIKKFYDYCNDHGIKLEEKNFTVEYDTNVPIRVGLAGSSAIVTSMMRALCTFYGVDIAKPVLPNLILSVELDELKIGAGLQDRVAQVYEGATYMDFGRKLMDAQGHGNYESLDPAKLPPLFVAYHSNLAEGTEVTHNSLRDRYNRGDKEVLAAIERWAALAEEARSLIDAGRGTEIAPLMQENFELRAKLVGISEGNQRLVDIAKEHGATCKFAGSGGAVIGVYDNDPQRLATLKQAYADFGGHLIVPEIV